MRIFLFKTIFLSAFLGLTISVVGQKVSTGNTAEFQYGHCLKEVHFSGNGGSSIYVSLKSDQESTYTAPQWSRQNPNCTFGDGGPPDHNYPIAYESGSKFFAKAVFYTDCIDSYFMRAVGEAGTVIFPSRVLIPSSGQATYNYTLATFATLSGLVNFYKDYKLIWQVSHNDTSWTSVDTSVHDIYLTHELNSSVHHQPPYMESIIHISCTAAKNLLSKSQIVDSIYNYLTLGDVRTKPGLQLGYWTSSSDFCHEAEELVKLGSGQCEAWADLQRYANNIHGIDGDKVVIYRNDDITPDSIATIKEEIHSFGLGYDTSYTSMQIYGTHLFAVKDWPSTYIRKIGEGYAADLPEIYFQDTASLQGVAGQNNLNPRSIFATHELYRQNGTYYDPSYVNVSKSTNIADHEDKGLFSVRTFTFAIKKNGQGQPILPYDIYIYHRVINTPSQDLGTYVSN